MCKLNVIIEEPKKVVVRPAKKIEISRAELAWLIRNGTMNANVAGRAYTTQVASYL